MVQGDAILGAVLVPGHQGERNAGRERRQAQQADAVILLELVVVGRVREGQRQHALLLQVGLVDAGETLHDDGAAAQETGFHGGVLTA